MTCRVFLEQIHDLAEQINCPMMLARSMAKKETITMKGTVIEPLPNRVFRVEVKDQHQALARVSGKMKHWTRILPGDCVVVEFSPDDLNRGIITSRC